MSDTRITLGFKIVATLALLFALPAWLALDSVQEVSAYSAIFWGLVGYFSMLIPLLRSERIGEHRGPPVRWLWRPWRPILHLYRSSCPVRAGLGPVAREPRRAG